MSSGSRTSTAAKSKRLEEKYRGPSVQTMYVSGQLLFWPVQTLNSDKLTPTDRFIAVPGVGTAPLQHWSNGDGGIWLTPIPPISDPNVAVFSFNHDLTVDDSFSWNALYDRGAELLDELVELAQDDEVRTICDSTIDSYDFDTVL